MEKKDCILEDVEVFIDNQLALERNSYDSKERSEDQQQVVKVLGEKDFREVLDANLRAVSVELEALMIHIIIKSGKVLGLFYLFFLSENLFLHNYYLFYFIFANVILFPVYVK